MTELSRGEKAKQTRIARIGIEAYKAEQARKGKKGGTNSVGQFKANPDIAAKAGKLSRRLPKSVTTTESGMEFETPAEGPINPTTEVDADELDKQIKHINRTQR